MTTRSCSFRSGQNASSLHWWIQVYHHLLRRLFLIWGDVLSQTQKWGIRCIQDLQGLGWKTTLKCRWFDWGEEFLSNEQKTYMAENGIEYPMSIPDSPQQNGRVERFQQTIVNGAEAMWHHTGLSNSFWIYAVKAKIHAYNVTPIKWADYKTPKELWSGQKPNISHLRVFGCLAWVHILKKRRHKLQPKSNAMIFIGYEPGSKGYQFWDAAHQCFEISCDVKFKETCFPVKESKLAQPILAPSSDHQMHESDNESDSSGLDLVNLAQPPTRPPSPDLPASGQPAQPSQSARPPSPPCYGSTWWELRSVNSDPRW